MASQNLQEKEQMKFKGWKPFARERNTRFWIRQLDDGKFIFKANRCNNSPSPTIDRGYNSWDFVRLVYALDYYTVTYTKLGEKLLSSKVV